MLNEINDYVLWVLIAIIAAAVFVYVRNHPAKVKRELANARDAFDEATVDLRSRADTERQNAKIRYDALEAKVRREWDELKAELRAKFDSK